MAKKNDRVRSAVDSVFDVGHRGVDLTREAVGEFERASRAVNRMILLAWAGAVVLVLAIVVGVAATIMILVGG